MSRCDISIKGKRFEGTKGFLDFLTRKNVNTELITTNDLKRYKNYLEMTKAHVVGKRPLRLHSDPRGPKFCKDDLQTVSTEQSSRYRSRIMETVGEVLNG
jgi:hypothetical protein